MPDRAVFIGFGQPVRGREERAVDVFNDFVGLFGRMAAAGRIEDMDVTLLDFHGGDLGGFFLLRGERDKVASARMSDELNEVATRAQLIVENFGIVGAEMGERIGTQMELFLQSSAELA